MLKKFKVGQRVRIIKKVDSWTYYGIRTPWWAGLNDNNDGIGNVYTIIAIAGKGGIDFCSGYRLNTETFECDWNAFYPEESLEAEIEIGQQLLFSFMESI